MRIGIDLGGTKIAGVVLDSAGQIAASQRIPTPQRDYEATLTALVTLVDALEVSVDATCSVGIGTPGSVSRLSAGRMKNCNSVCLNGQPLPADLEKRLGRPVRVANDADCLAISESVDGAAAGASPVLAVILGTGVGGGLTVAGCLVAGADGNAGEWGHNPLPAALRPAGLPSRPCYCGRQDCVEAWLSGAGLVATAQASGVPVATARELTARVQRGERGAGEVLERYFGQLAGALAGVINILDPQVVVLGGGLSQLPGIEAAVQDRLAPHVFSDRVAARVRRALHGDASGVRGAAWLWPAAAADQPVPPRRFV